MSQTLSEQNWILLGASRGLGAAFADELKLDERQNILVASRKSDWKMNFADKAHWGRFVDEMAEKKPARIVYFAGGGPFGNFTDKEWKDHEWALRVNFEFPAYFVHALSRQYSTDPNLKNLKQVVWIGSSIAESSPDPGASSYGAAKHALVGLAKNLHAEKSLPFDLRLMSPGYMDTDLLPANAWPRQKQGLVQSPKSIAKVLLPWLLDDSKSNSQLVIPPHS